MWGPFIASCWPYMAALIGLCVLSVFVKNEQHAGTALVLLANWGLCSGVVLLTGDPYPFAWFIAVDWVSAVAILVGLGFRSWPQRFIALIFAVELICHAARGWIEFRDTIGISVKAANYYGYYTLRYAAWAQVLIAAIWGVHEFVGARRGVAGGLSHNPAGVAPRRSTKG